MDALQDFYVCILHFVNDYDIWLMFQIEPILKSFCQLIGLMYKIEEYDWKILNPADYLPCNIVTPSKFQFVDSTLQGCKLVYYWCGI